MAWKDLAKGPLAHTPDIVLEIRDAKITAANPAAELEFGKSESELLGCTADEIVAGSDQQLSSALSELDESAPATRFCTHWLCQDSQWCYIDWQAFRNEGGDAVILIGRDTTDQVASEKEYRNKLDLFRKTTEVSGTGGWELILDGMQLSWTEQVYHIHALPLSYVPNVESAIDFYDEASKPIITAAVDRCLEYGEPYDLQLKIIDARGIPHWVRAIGEAESVDGVATRLYGTFQDITDMVEREQDRRRSDRRFRAAFEGAPHGVALVAISGRFLQTNRGLRQMLGYTEEQFSELTFMEITHPDDLKSNLNIASSLIDGEINTFTVEKRYKRVDGTYINGLLSTSLVTDDDRKPLYYVSHIRDLSAEKKLELERQKHQLQMQQSQKLESLGILAGGIAHDFNNLLMGIIGNAEVAMISTEEHSLQREPLTRVINGSKRAAELCSQLLAYAGKGKLEVQQHNLVELVSEMGRLLEVAASGSTVIDYQLPEDGLPIVADGTQIRQVVMNLITNACDAIDDNSGRVIVRAYTARLSREDFSSFQLGDETAPGEYAVLKVSDNGVGMDSSTLRRIFDPFFTTKSKGRGLGLAATIGIVKSHNGAVHVESSRGVGTTFTVALPIAATQAAVEEQTGNFRVLRGSGNVMFVDDDESIRIMAEGLLRNAGYEVTLAENGEHALQIYQQDADDIDAIVMDLNMPRMTGQQCYQHIREIDDNVPVILSSGFLAGDDESLAVMQGVHAFLHKPYRSDELLGLLQECIPTEAA